MSTGVHSSGSESTPRPVKRMRIGTKSCAECRRRKVRCVYDEGQAICQECRLHDSTCEAQQPAGSARINLSGEESEGFQQRLEQLESLVRHVYRTFDLDSESASSRSTSVAHESPAIAARAALRKLTPITSIEDDNFAPMEAVIDTSEKLDPELSHDAPLLKLFNEAMVIQSEHLKSFSLATDCLQTQQIKANAKVLKALVPFADLGNILQQIERYFQIWPIWPMIPDAAAGGRFLNDSLNSEDPILFTKGICLLALCIQQLPRSFQLTDVAFPTPNERLLQAYLRGTENLLNSIDLDTATSVDLVECFNYRSRVFVDMGRPRKAWLETRRAISAAMMLGLHRKESRRNMRYVAVWSQAWQNDLQLSLILGLPHAVQDPDTELPFSDNQLPAPMRLMQDISRTCGHINDRNLKHDRDYAMTMQIDEELTQISNMSRQWPQPESFPDAASALADAFPRAVVHIFICKLTVLLHLPFAMDQTPGPACEYSRDKSLRAARELVQAYQTLRGKQATSAVLCDVMDFQALTGAIVLIIYMFKTAHAPGSSPTVQEAQDWTLILDLVKHFRKTDTLLNCSVARQAADLLEALSRAFHGQFNEPHPVDVVIPYFGKVSIRPLRRMTEEQPSTTEVEFNMHQAMPSEPYMGGAFAGTELGIDWTSGFDLGSDFDWSELFRTAGPGPSQ